MNAESYPAELTSLPPDVMLSVLSYLTAREVESKIMILSKSIWKEATSELLWKGFCERTGKLTDSAISARVHSESSCQLYRSLYYSIPCVPTDFQLISSALSHCPSGSTISILPGWYADRLQITRPVTLRAAFPNSSAAIVWQSPALNECCISIEEGSGEVTLENLEILHFTRGADIWNGNCAILAYGNNLRLRVVRCSIQSDSGRGLVCAGGAFTELIQTTIHHCSATGLYIGDYGTVAAIHESNVVCNGFGTRQLLLSRSPAVRSNDSDDDDASYADENVFDPSSIFRPAVIPGHSGVYVERAKADISDCLIGGNCLTGLSVVRRGVVHIKACDVTSNGHLPIMVQDAYDEPLQSLEGGLIQRDNNYSTIRSVTSADKVVPDEAIENPERAIAVGGRVRDNPFPDAVRRPTTWHQIRCRYL